jgi:hypothetical protein
MLKKIVQALTCGAVGVVGANGLLCLLSGQLRWFGPDATLRVGLPAALIGMLFFPVNLKTLGTRWSFAGRAALAAAICSLANRVLLFGARSDGVWNVVTHPSALLPSWPPDGNFVLGALATVTTGLAGWLLQPAMMRIARGMLPPHIERLSDALEAIAIPAESRRTRVR